MNIKAKLIEQLGVLENLQLMATNAESFDTALSTSRTILEYIRIIDMAIERDGEDECPCHTLCTDKDDDYICPNCEEAILKEMLHQDIANACDLPIELVNRVLAGQDAVYDKLEE